MLFRNISKTKTFYAFIAFCILFSLWRHNSTDNIINWIVNGHLKVNEVENDKDTLTVENFKETFTMENVKETSTMENREEITKNKTMENDKQNSRSLELESLVTLLNELDGTILKKVTEKQIYGNIFSGKSTQQLESYIDAIREFSKNHSIRTVCEIGFAGGHSATLFLKMTPRLVNYIAFDIWNRPLYEDAALKWIKEKFSDRQIKVIKGDASKTVPLYQGSCDIIHIDGAHHADFPQTDMQNMYRISSENNLLLIDDCTDSWPSVLQGVKNLEKNNLVHGIKQHAATGWSYRGAQKGWCIGKYNKDFVNSVTFLGEKLCIPSWNGKDCDRYIAQKSCSKNSDECFYNEQSGVLSVSCERWKSAQKVEEETWDNKQRNHARNEEHAESYNYYRTLPDNLGDVIEIGAGPFTQTKTIFKYRKPVSTSVTLLEPMAFHYMLHAKYCFYPNGSFSNLPTTLLGIPAEELHETRQFDTLVMINVIEHVYDALSILESSINLVKEGGLFIWHERLWDDYKGLPKYPNEREFQLHPIRIKSVIAKLVMKMFDPIYESWDTAELRRLKNQGVYFIGRRNSVVARTNIRPHIPCFDRPEGKQTVVFFISMSNVTTLQEQINMADRTENTKRIALIQTDEMDGRSMSEIFKNKKIEIMLSYHHLSNWKEEIGYYTTPCLNIVPKLTEDMLTSNRTVCIGLA